MERGGRKGDGLTAQDGHLHHDAQAQGTQGSGLQVGQQGQAPSGWVSGAIQGQTGSKGFEIIFAPAAKLASIRIVISIAVGLGWAIEQTDVDATFLYAMLDTLIYMEQPEGHADPEHDPDWVCELKKSLYGLKQAASLWFKRMADKLLTINLIHVTPLYISDNCIQTQRSSPDLMRRELHA